MLTPSQETLLAQAVAIEEQEAREAGALGFMARAVVLATLPHRDPAVNEFIRSNGSYTLTLLAPSKVGLPYGTIPRLLLAWMSTEAVRTQDPTLVLGDTLSEFMRELELIPTGGRWGSITRLREQMRRLFSCSISCEFSDQGRDSGAGFRIAKEYNLWWHPQQPEQAGLWKSSVTLTSDFFEEVTRYPVPIDLRALKALRRSPLALDTYMWLVHRLSYLKKPTMIPWPLLVAQFGADYSRERDFRTAFSEALQKVKIVYPAAQVVASPSGLQISPSRTHIPR